MDQPNFFTSSPCPDSSGTTSKESKESKGSDSIEISIDPFEAHWEVASIAQIGAAAGLGAGGYWFEYRSPSENLREVFLYLGGGFGVGGGFSGTTGGKDWDEGGLEFAPIDCSKPFSISNLDMSFGLLDYVGGSVVIGDMEHIKSQRSTGMNTYFLHKP